MRPPVRRLRRRRHGPRATRALVVLALLGPGLLAGLSDDDPAGITTYSVLGADYGYELLWVLGVSVAALIVFHEIGARLGVATGKGLGTLLRERHGERWALAGLAVLLPANLGTCCAELAGISAALAPLRCPGVDRSTRRRARRDRADVRGLLPSRGARAAGAERGVRHVFRGACVLAQPRLGRGGSTGSSCRACPAAVRPPSSSSRRSARRSRRGA